MKFLRLTVIFLLAIFACSCSNHDVSQYVDPLIGTDGHGHVYPGAALPFGMVQLSPDTRKDSWDGCSGYHYSDTTIMGFSHTHLSGTGVGDYGDIRFMPTVGELRLNPGAADDPSSGYRSTFSHANEVATPGYYSVILEDYDVDVELTVTKRAGFHKYTYPEGDKSNIIIDLTEGVTSDRIIDLRIEFVNDTEVQGLRRTDGWSNNQYVFFNAKFSKPFKGFGILSDGVKQDSLKIAQGKDIKAWVTFDTEKREDILVKVGISAVDVNGAKNNRENEISGWDFSKIRKQAGK
nr:glycoside hydrolase family 92 protein [Bacteroidota bacterium]